MRLETAEALKVMSQDCISGYEIPYVKDMQ